ncbi:MAG TPA: TetR/AcrR family transcriptional regulator [Phaeodactylibacter sp.]|nr:TetR/AcrR family transcriptional regulator [Phaeodactylibacter sp.]
MTDKKQQRFRQMREESSALIRRAAMQLFARKGYGNTSMDEIAREAGVSKGLIYNYFDSKQSLLLAIIREGIELLRHLECSIYDSGAPPKAVLTHLLEAVFQAATEQPDYWRLYTLMLLKGNTFELVQQPLHDFMNESLQRMAGLFKQLSVKNPNLEARFLAATLDGVLLHYLFTPKDYPLQQMQEHLLKRFLPTQNK